MSLPIYQRVAVTDAGDVIPGAEYTVINENTGVAAPIYSDRTGATLLTAPYFADSVGTIQFFIAQGTTFRVAASGGVGTYTDRYVYGVAEAVLVDASGNVGIGVVPETWFPSLNTTALQIGDTTSIWSLTNGSGDLRTSLDSNLYIDASGNDKYLNTGPGTRYQQIAGEHRWSSAASGTADSTATVSDRMRIDSSGNIGIGTISPSAPLQVVSSENLVAKFSSSDVTSGIRIEDTTTSYDFYVDSGNLRINNTAGSEKMRIDSVGNLLVGTTSVTVASQTGTTQGVRIAGADNIQVASTGVSAYFNKLSTDGSIVEFRKSGTTVGSIGTLASRITIGTDDTGLIFQSAFDNIQPVSITANTGRDAAISLGASDNRFKDLHLSGGVYLGGTGAANKLDDYEEGDWTPIISAGGTTTAAAVSANCHYVKVGNLVTLSGYLYNIVWADITDGSSIIMENIPFQVEPFAAATLAHNNTNISELRTNANDLIFSRASAYVNQANNDVTGDKFMFSVTVRTA